MMALMVALLLLAFLGHAMFSVRLLNRLHAIALPRWCIKLLSLVVYLWGAGVPLAFAGWIWRFGLPTEFWPPMPAPYAKLVWAYVLLALLAAGICLPQWLWWRYSFRPPPQLLSNHTSRADLAKLLDGKCTRGLANWYASLPGNEILLLETSEKVVAPPRWPAALDSLSIAHLSDLHLSGWIDRCYFEEVVRRTNQLQADLVMIAGDLVDFTRYIDIACEVLAGLQAPSGVYFVLGNHDQRVDYCRLRSSLAEAGLIDLAGRHHLLSIHGQSLLLAGDEMPWIPPPPDLRHAPVKSQNDEPLPRILLAHTPDRIDFARRHNFDVLLAGHTHGGQICLPFVGPLVAPSRYGVRYAGGTFYEPPTLMHVSRGVSALQLVRWNCPPEITRLVLRHPPDASSRRH